VWGGGKGGGRNRGGAEEQRKGKATGGGKNLVGRKVKRVREQGADFVQRSKQVVIKVQGGR